MLQNDDLRSAKAASDSPELREPQVTLQEAASILGLTADTLRQQIANGKLVAIKRGRDWWVEPAEVERYRLASRRRSVSPEHRRLIQLVFDEFHEHAAWPDLRVIQHRLELGRDLFDILAAARSLPGFLGRLDLNEYVERITVYALRYCDGAETEQADFSRVVERFYAAYQKDGPKANVTSDDLRDQMRMDETTIRKMFMLLDTDMLLKAGGSWKNETSWQHSVSDNVPKFRNVHSFDDYIQVAESLLPPAYVFEPEIDRALPSKSAATGALVSPVAPGKSRTVRRGRASKPLLFISHITEEAPMARVVKEAIETGFHGKVEVFVSSSPETIRLGDRWLDRITVALRDCDVAVILASPMSLPRPWINFEAGAVWVRGVPVVPLCHSGMTPALLPLPLRMLQAAQATSEEGLRGLFSLVARAAGSKVPQIDFTALASAMSSAEQAGALGPLPHDRSAGSSDPEQSKAPLTPIHGDDPTWIGVEGDLSTLRMGSAELEAAFARAKGAAAEKIGEGSNLLLATVFLLPRPSVSFNGANREAEKLFGVSVRPDNVRLDQIVRQRPGTERVTYAAPWDAEPTPPWRIDASWQTLVSLSWRRARPFNGNVSLAWDEPRVWTRDLTADLSQWIIYYGHQRDGVDEGMDIYGLHGKELVQIRKRGE